MSFQFDSDRVKRHIKETLDKVYNEADPALLNQYRQLIKKEVSFFRRSYLAAYLLMEADQRSGGGGGKRYGGRDDRFSRGKESSGGGPRKYGNEGDAPEEGQRGEGRVYPLAEEESVRLFFSVGRSRKVFPREILGLIISKTQVAKDDVGAIRILDNYSFVQVRATVADDIINALNGKSFRGRTLSINYARAKNDTDPDSDEKERPIAPPETGDAAYASTDTETEDSPGYGEGEASGDTGSGGFDGGADKEDDGSQ
jgi:uncharacterized membrane protein YgcG